MPTGRYKKPLFTFKSGDSYFGEWVGNHPDGFGIMNYADGKSYEGEFKNGLKHGNGE